MKKAISMILTMVMLLQTIPFLCYATGNEGILSVDTKTESLIYTEDCYNQHNNYETRSDKKSYGLDYNQNLNENTSSFSFLIENDNVTITGYTGNEMDVSIPEIIEGYPVTAIGEKCFYYCNTLQAITIPKSIKEIGKRAFEGCTALKNIYYYAASVTNLDKLNYVFKNAGNMSEGLNVVFENTVETLPNYLFYNCTLLKHVTFLEGLTKIGASAFEGCIALEEIEIPGSVATVGSYSFYGCTGLKKLSLNEGVGAIWYYAFKGCTSLTELTIPGSSEIWANSFQGCLGLKKVFIMEGVPSIGSDAFNGCTGLIEVTIPSSINHLDPYIFKECLNLETIYYNAVWAKGIGPESHIFQNAGVEGAGLHIIFGDSVNVIPNYLCDGCTGLKKVTISNQLQYVHLCAFRNCTGLTDVYYNGHSEEWNKLSIDDGNDPLLNATIHFAHEDSTPSFKSQSLVLSGQIGLNFFLELPEISGVDYSKSYMTFTIGKDPTEYRDNFDPNHMNSGKTRYGFTCFVNSIQMADTIKAVFHYGNGKTVSKDYSVAQYIDFFEKNIGSFNAKTITLIRAIADFGHYEQIYLADVNGWTIGDKYAEMATHYTDIFNYASILSAVNDKAFVKSLGSSNVEKATYKLHLDSETTVDVFLTPKSGKTLTASATFNGKTYTAVKQSDGRYLVQIPNISAHQLGEMITVTGTAGTAFSVKVSALSYTRSVLNNTSSNTAAKDGLSALYQYYTAVLAYRK